MQSQRGSVVAEIVNRAATGRKLVSAAEAPYFETVRDRKGYYQRLHIVQEFALANLRSAAYRVWDWIERTLRQQQHYHPERPAVLIGMSVADITKKLNTWAPESRYLSTRTVERAIQDLQRAGFLAVDHRYRTTPDGLRLQLPSAYRLLCPAALRLLLKEEAPAFSQENSQPARQAHPTDKKQKSPPTKLADQNKKTSKKEKRTLPPKDRNVLEPVSGGEPTRGEPKPLHQARWDSLFQYWRDSQGKSLLEALALMCEVEAHWTQGSAGIVGGVLIAEGGWKLLN